MDAIHAQASYASDYIIDWHQLKAISSNTLTQITNDDLNLLLLYLQTLGECVVSADSKTIKFKSKSEQVLQITSVDVGILTIKTTIACITLQMSEIDSKIKTLDTKTRLAVSQGLKSRGLVYLKQKKNMVSIMDKRIASLDTLSQILDGIHHAESQVDVLTL